MTRTPPPSAHYVLEENVFPTITTDGAGHITYANPAYVALSGYTSAELAGMPSTQMMAKDNPPQVLRDMILTIRGQQPWTGVLKLVRNGGQTLWVRLNIAPVFAGKVYGGGLLVHARASAEEVALVEPLYRRMLDSANSDLVLRHGRVFRATRWGRFVQAGREMGLKLDLVGSAVALSLLAIAGFAVQGDVTSPTFWAASAAFAGAAAAVSHVLHRRIVRPLRAAVELANRIAAGDLHAISSSRRSDEIGAMLRALTQMNINMRSAVSDVRDGVTLMQHATAEIAHGTQDLSARTEMQAGNLQETAASMEQIHVTVQNNADTARQASTVAAAACTAAETGGRVVGDVITTMEGITRSSKQIAEIIGVIDGIAFQTNILALNAAVEAARAGEHGRGFAVVASEVRSLAQRSAQSAKEIRKLISDSVQQVEGGSRLVDAAGKSIGDIVTQVRRVTELVSHIASASHEQSSGIWQINQAVTQLDQMTQQNAALVEESTASAESLRAQSVRVVDSVALFKLSQAERDAMVSGANAERVREGILRNERAAGLAK